MGTIEAFVEATRDVSLEALTRSVEQFTSGKVDRNNAFAPSSAELAENARLWHRAIELRSAAGEELHNGLLDCDWGQGRVNMRGLTTEEQDRVIANKGCGPDGKSLAYLPVEAIRAALAVDALEVDKRKVIPSLRGMGS